MFSTRTRNVAVSWSLAVVVCLLGVGRATSAPITADVFFSGTEQTLSADVTGSGSVVSQGSGVLIGVPFTINPSPQTDLIGLDPDTVSLTTNPVSLTDDGVPVGGTGLPTPVTTQFTFDDETWDVLDISNMHTDLLNGQTISAALDTIFIELSFGGIPGTIDIGAALVIKELSFWQDAMQSVTIDSQSGSFAVPGNIRAVLDASVLLINDPSSIVITELLDEVVEFPLDIVGTITTTNQGGPDPQDVLLELDGDFEVVAPIMESLIGTAGVPGISFDGSVELAVSLLVDLAYHMEYLLQDIHSEPNGLLGDISGDGEVDIADFTLWADAFGQTGVGLPADITEDGEVDIADFTLWADNFGNTAGIGNASGANAVPEPSSVVLLGLGIVGMIIVTWRRRRAA